MKHNEHNLEMLTIVGIEVRTTNQNEKAQKDIGQLWSDFFVNNIGEQIPYKISEDIYCIYSNYESDFNGEYTTYIGCAVSKVEMLPNNLVTTTIPAGKYIEFVSKGKLPDCVGNTWNHIWTNEYNRAYLADFDLYGKETRNSENTEVKTFLSIK